MTYKKLISLIELFFAFFLIPNFIFAFPSGTQYRFLRPPVSKGDIDIIMGKPENTADTLAEKDISDLLTRIKIIKKLPDSKTREKYLNRDYKFNPAEDMDEINNLLLKGILFKEFKKIYPEVNVEKISEIIIQFAVHCNTDIYYKVTFVTTNFRNALFVGMNNVNFTDPFWHNLISSEHYWNFQRRLTALNKACTIAPDLFAKPGNVVQNYNYSKQSLEQSLENKELYRAVIITEFLEGKNGAKLFKEATNNYKEFNEKAKQITISAMQPYIDFYVKSYDKEKKVGLICDDMSILNIIFNPETQKPKIGDVFPLTSRGILQEDSIYEFMERLEKFLYLSRIKSEQELREEGKIDTGIFEVDKRLIINLIETTFSRCGISDELIKNENFIKYRKEIEMNTKTVAGLPAYKRTKMFFIKNPVFSSL